MKKNYLFKLFLTAILIFSLSALNCGCGIADYFGNRISNSDRKHSISVNADPEETVTVEESEIGTEIEFLTAYASLSKEQQRIYRIMRTAAYGMVSGFINLGECGNNYKTDIAIAFRALSFDSPDLFWLPNTYIIGTSQGLDDTAISVAFDYSDGDFVSGYTVSREEKEHMALALENRALEIAAAAMQATGEYERELYIHDLLCDTVTYFDDGEMCYTAYGALINNKAVCEGYSRAFQLLCRKIGIPCEPVYGSTEDGGHMWNTVKIEGEWYLTDVTWDDSEDLLSRYYFNLTSDKMNEDHTESPTYNAVSDIDPESGEAYNFNIRSCNSDKNNFFVKENAVITEENFEIAASVIEKANLLGRNYAELIFKDGKVKNNFNSNQSKYTDGIQRLLKSVVLSEFSVYGNAVTFYW